MKDARGTIISIGDDVVFHQKQHNDIHYAWAVISWGNVVKINAQMIRVQDHNGKEFSKAPHNCVVVYMP